MYKFILSFFIFLFFSVVSNVSAHVKWFVDSSSVINESHDKIPFYYLSSIEVYIWAIVSIIVVLVFSIFDTLIKDPVRVVEFRKKHEYGIDRWVGALLGLYLVSVSVLWGVVLIPDFPVTDMWSYTLEFIQFVVGGMLMFNIFPVAASIGVIGLCGILFYQFGLIVLLENLITLSLAIYLIIRHAKHSTYLKYLNRHAVEIVRIGTGVALIVMAFSEKLAYPELGMAFLEIHQWNFMAVLGFEWFSDKLFVLSTGFAEMIFGVIFILGYLTRVNTILIASFFAASVVTMAVQFGQWEVEDLVVYAAAILFVFYGHGKTKFFHYVWPESVLHTSHLKTWFKGVPIINKIIK
jgi:hypothetical protein